MRRIFETRDVKFLKRLLAIDSIYDLLAYDGSPSLQEFVPEGVWIILVDGSDFAGFINFKALNNVIWSPHIFIIKEYRGKDSVQWGKQAIDYMNKKYGVKKYLAFTPYLSAMRYAEKVGFKYMYTLTNSIQKNGKLLDQWLLELPGDKK